MALTYRYGFLLIALIAFSVLLAGCAPETPVYITNRNPFPITVQMIGDDPKARIASKIPSNSAARIGWVGSYRAYEYTLRVARESDQHHPSGKLAPSIILGEHLIVSMEKRRGRFHYIVEGGALIASNDEPQDPYTLSIKHLRMNLFFYLVGILGCLITVARLYKQRKTKLR